MEKKFWPGSAISISQWSRGVQKIEIDGLADEIESHQIDLRQKIGVKMSNFQQWEEFGWIAVSFQRVICYK